MPQRNIWIRKEDLKKWDMIYNPDWLHDMIHSEKAVVTSVGYKISEAKEKIVNDIIKTPTQAKVATAKLQPAHRDSTGEKVCPEHGIPLDSRGRCMQKKCKYA